MTCLKTGAVVHMLAHNVVFHADLFAVAGAVVVRANGPIIHGKNAWPRESKFSEYDPPTHELTDCIGDEFWREDLGIFVVPKDKLRELA